MMNMNVVKQNIGEFNEHRCVWIKKNDEYECGKTEYR